MKLKNFERQRIEDNMRFFRTYLKEMEQVLQEKDVRCKKEIKILEKEENPLIDNNYLIELYDEHQQYFKFFYYSFIITIFSFFEYELNEICEKTPIEIKTKIRLGDIKKRGTERSKIFMEKILNLTLPNKDLWEELMCIKEVRNCLTHSSGEIKDRDGNEKKLINYIEKSGKIKIEEDPITKIKHIEMEKEYYPFVIEIIEKYLLALVDKNPTKMLKAYGNNR